MDADQDIRSRAASVGIDGGYAVMRLAYGSYVSLPRRYVYVETPKVASTALKHLVTAVEGARFDGAESGMVPYGESRLDMLIHQRSRIHLPTVLKLDQVDRREICEGGAGWFVFAVVRNPFSRRGGPTCRGLHGGRSSVSGHPRGGPC